MAAGEAILIYQEKIGWFGFENSSFFVEPGAVRSGLSTATASETE